MKGIPLFVLVNRIDPAYSLSTVRSDIDPILKRQGVERCFGAFDFQIPASKDKTPVALLNGDNAGSYPAFFEIDSRDAANDPALVGEDRFLDHLLRSLPKSELSVKSIAGLWEGLANAVNTSLDQIHARTAKDEVFLSKMHQTFLDVSVALLCDQEGNPKVPVTPELLEQIAGSFDRTAPWYSRPSMWIGKGIKRIKQGCQTFAEGVGASLEQLKECVCGSPTDPC